MPLRSIPADAPGIDLDASSSSLSLSRHLTSPSTPYAAMTSSLSPDDRSPLFDGADDLATDLATDWSQWMAWDDPTVDLDVRKPPPPPPQLRDSTMAPRDLDLSPSQVMPITPESAVSDSSHAPIALSQQLLAQPPPSFFDYHPQAATAAATTTTSAAAAAAAAAAASQPSIPPNHPPHPQQQQQQPPPPLRPGLRPSVPLAPSAAAVSAAMPPIDTKKRKAELETPVHKPMPSKKRSHNVIEKRYRANLNDKIAELRDSVPSLRVIARQRGGSTAGAGAGVDDDDGDDPAGAANKLNKASILSKATEYIRHLEQRNKRLDEENLSLKNRLRHVEKLHEQNAGHLSVASASSPDSYAATSATEPSSGSSPGIFSAPDDFSPEGSPNPLYPPEGLIQVPDFLRKMRQTANEQPPYNTASPHFCSPSSPLSFADSSSPHTFRHGGGGGGGPSRFMLGTLAALMIVGFESKQKPEEERGLAALPLEFLELGVQQVGRAAVVTWSQLHAFLPAVIYSALIFGLFFSVFFYLFNSRPRGSGKEDSAAAAAAAIHGRLSLLRRDAWLTSMQTVWVPRHDFLVEACAVATRCAEYCVRCLLGWNVYSALTSVTDEDERARVKAWDIALDAQLSGGDPELDRARLLLTIFAAGTLPRSPSRIMLKALHVRVLLWRVGPDGSFLADLVHRAAVAVASYQWRHASRLHASLPFTHENRLPPHLARLLAMPCSHVLNDAVVQRAVNLVWNRPTEEATDGASAMLDVVVDDAANASPLDYVAAWWSSTRLQSTLLNAVDLESINPAHLPPRPNHKSAAFRRGLDLALVTAPPASTAQIRARVLRAVFFDEDRVAHINAVLGGLPRDKSRPTVSSTSFLDSTVPVAARDEISIAVRCAMITAILRRQILQHAGTLIGVGGRVQIGTTGGRNPRLTVAGALRLFNSLPVDPVDLTLVGFVSLYHLLHVVAEEEVSVLSPPLSQSSSPTGSAGSSSASSSSSSTATASSEDGTTTAAADDDDDDDDADADPNERPFVDLTRVAGALGYWVRDAYNPVSFGITPRLRNRIIRGCVDVCRAAGRRLSLRPTEWRGSVRQSSQRGGGNSSSSSSSKFAVSSRRDAPRLDSCPEGVSYPPPTPPGSPPHSPRRTSVMSTDTGYGSLSQDEDVGGSPYYSPRSSRSRSLAGVVC